MKIIGVNKDCVIPDKNNPNNFMLDTTIFNILYDNKEDLEILRKTKNFGFEYFITRMQSRELKGLRVEDDVLVKKDSLSLETKQLFFKEVMEVLDRKYLFRYYGPDDSPSKVRQLEEEFAEKIGTKHALATNACTSSLITSLVALGVGPGDFQKALSGRA